MKLWVAVFSLLAVEAAGQSDSSGLFLSAADYLRNHLTLPACCESPGNSIRPHRYFGKRFITLYRNHLKYSYHKSDVFGYRNCTKQTFRFFLDDVYEILSFQGIWLYQQRGESDWDDYHVFNEYFFSKDPTAIVYPLDKYHLKWIFKNEARFVQALDSVFKNYDELDRFDDTNKLQEIINTTMN